MINPVVENDTVSTVPSLFTSAIKNKYGSEVRAIILYGSWLRGTRDTLLDFYVILNSYKALKKPLHRMLNGIIAPNVYAINITHQDKKYCAKYATISYKQFKKGIQNSFHPYFWARFAQPCELAYYQKPEDSVEITSLFRDACTRLVTETVPLLPETFSFHNLWSKAFELTYKTELRSESEDTPDKLACHIPPSSMKLVKIYNNRIKLSRKTDNTWTAKVSKTETSYCKMRWRLRIAAGKALSAIRVLKSAITFEAPLEYLLWKIERHTGIIESPSRLQKKYPLIFSWPLLWRIYRRGGFR